ncbi:hypothetical protein SAMN05216257_101641 [Meinhardsimonia xiamenensis]|uniref:DUF1643 domain-containing protein n=1 Tax=Meinhardsimonia xiamenensis TaxID=990712 RepID=A0A1G8Z9W0_9RHOB|nr:DUF1643 domain-containing protein [Meinhardsimonia xiamenensis]PRX37616.1 hypothetical protein LV81_01396 [Meinhardsimonia xiamenensis]SDK11896.1 hypothetical protein SAMN05216257_101641 [Meinhardsimonia xiamenensis]
MAITRSFEKGGTRSRAVYSDCKGYRYALTRVWDEAAPRLLYVMLNPSTATERANDPTIERCERRARALGQGAFGVVNLFAFRATRPADLFAAPDPVGPENDAAIAEAAAWADAILCAWGAHGARQGRAEAVTALLRRAGKPMFHLGLTKGGQPRHPLYVGYAVPLQPWGAAAKTSGLTST